MSDNIPDDVLWRLARCHQWLLDTQRFTEFPFASHIWASWGFDRRSQQRASDDGMPEPT